MTEHECEVMESVFWQRVEAFFQAKKPNLLVVMGRWGMGKTALAQELVRRFRAPDARALGVPVYLQSSRFRSTDVATSTADQLSEILGQDVPVQDLRLWLSTGKVVLVLDRLDELPYRFGEHNVMDGVSEFVAKTSVEPQHEGKVVIVAREEFYDSNMVFRKLVQDRRGCVIRVHGFGQVQIRAFLKQADPQHGTERSTAVEEAIASDRTLDELFRVPQILTRVSKIGVERIQSMVSAGVTLASIYSSSFDEVPSPVQTLCEGLAFHMYRGDLFHVDVTQEVLNRLRCSAEQLEAARREGLLRKVADAHEFAQ